MWRYWMEVPDRSRITEVLDKRCVVRRVVDERLEHGRYSIEADNMEMLCRGRYEKLRKG